MTSGLSTNAKTVLVPVDFSPASRAAVNYGVKLSRRLKAKLILLHVIELPGEPKHPLEVRAAKLEREQAERMLPAMVAPEDQDDLDLSLDVRTGNAADQIAAAAAEHQAAIIVMGKHGRGFLERWIFGSVAEATLRRSTVPVLTVGSDPGSLSFQRILFATDLAAPVEPGLHAALDFARGTPASLVLFHVVRPPLAVGEGGTELYSPESDLELARGSLTKFAVECRAQNVNTEVVTVSNAFAAPAILEAAEQNGAELIVIVVRKKGVMERALIGSTAEKLVRESRIPVLSVPALSAA